jgi:hypothetical protein
MNDDYLIWSIEHDGWWGPGESGYVKRVSEAGRYSRDRALAICANAWGTAAHIGTLAELPVRLDDVAAFLARNDLWPANVL